MGIATASNGAQCTSFLIRTLSSSLMESLNGDDASDSFGALCYFRTSPNPLQRVIGSSSCQMHNNLINGLDILGRAQQTVSVTSWDTHKQAAQGYLDRIKNAEDMIQGLGNSMYTVSIVNSQAQQTQSAVANQGAATRSLVISSQTQLSAQMTELSNSMKAGFDNTASLVR